MAYTYFNSEPGLWTVGTHDGGRWESESDHNTPEKAAARVHYLNGGNPAYDELLAALKKTQALLFMRTDAKDEEAMAALQQSRAALTAAGAA